VTTDSDTGSAADLGGPPRAALVAAVALAVTVIGVILVVAANREPPSRPVVLPAVPASQAASTACRTLTDALPQRLGDYRRAPVSQPAPPSATAWRAVPDGPSVVLRCGLDRPAGFVVGSPIQIVDRVQWFEAAAEQHTESAGDAGQSTWYTVDRPVYVALTLPSGSGPTPIQQISEIIDHTMAAVPSNPAPAQ